MMNLDDNIGKFMAFIEKSGLSDNTILIFMTDNGATGGCGMYNAGMRGSKANLWEGGHRVPFFIRVPGNKPRSIDGLAQAEDVFPTILELCNVKPTKDCNFDGISLAPQILSKKKLPDKILVNQFQRRLEVKKYDACIMWGPWRLINVFDSIGEDSKEIKELYALRKKEYQINLGLYNIEKDPHQDNNVIESYPEIAAKMKDYYEKWWDYIEPEMFKRGRIIIGSNEENPMILCATSWADTYFTQKRNVLEGRKATGTWTVDAETDGCYRFRMYRWPPETKSPIRCAINMYYTDSSVLGEFTEGKYLDIRHATIEINGDKHHCPVVDGDLYAEFIMNLAAGKTEIKADFLDKDEKLVCGAYYVEVTKL